MVYLCKLSSSLGNCYWLFLSHSTGTEKTFRLTWQNLPRRRQRVLHAWLGTTSRAGTNHFIFHAGREKSDNNWWRFINDLHGLQASPTAIKPPGCILLLRTAHWIFRRTKQMKGSPMTWLLQGSYFLLISSFESTAEIIWISSNGTQWKGKNPLINNNKWCTSLSPNSIIMSRVRKPFWGLK